MSKERIDKLIASNGNLSRKDASKLIFEKAVTLNGEVVKSGSQKADSEFDIIAVQGENLSLKRFIYLMLNKPSGVVSASSGKGEKTVVDLVPDNLKRNGLFPAGRLDKDTLGFVLITDDGDFAHYILSPKHHIDKTYLVSLSDELKPDDIEILEKGLLLHDGTQLLPSSIKTLSDKSCEITICEGKYHQIKRMFKAVGNEVTELKRIKMGNLFLDENLPVGFCREITPDELNLIMQK